MTFNAASRLRSLEDRSAALGSRRCELPDICSLAIRLWGWRPEPEALKYIDIDIHISTYIYTYIYTHVETRGRTWRGAFARLLRATGPASGLLGGSSQESDPLTKRVLYST